MLFTDVIWPGTSLIDMSERLAYRDMNQAENEGSARPLKVLAIPEASL